MKRITFSFLGAFSFDGLLSLANYIVPDLSALQQTVAILVFLAAILMHVGMALTPRLPKRILLPATLFTIWCALTNAFPSAILFGTHSQVILSLAQMLLGVGLCLTLRGSMSLPAWQRPAFSWGNFATVSGLNVAFALLIVILSILSGLSVFEEKTAGYVRIRPDGISLEERWFQRKDGKSVRLVGMVHVAKDRFYNELAETLTGKESVIVLLEGITDKSSLLQGDLSYSAMADSLGLTSQSDSEFMKVAAEKSKDRRDSKTEATGSSALVSGIQYWRADVDTSDFQASTLDCLEAVSSLFSSQSWREVMQKLSDPTSPLNQEADNEVFWSDVIHLRNEHLIEEMEEALRVSDIVVVPWGALHMPVFERQLKDWGFQETHRVRRLAFSFWEKTLAQNTIQP